MLYFYAGKNNEPLCVWPNNCLISFQIKEQYMKRLILFSLLSIGMVNITDAQRYEYGEAVPMRRHSDGGSLSETRFGLFISPTISWMKPTSNKSDDKLYLVNGEGSKVGFTWGLMIDHYFAENYGIYTGFQLNNTGGKISTAINPAYAPDPLLPNTVLSSYFDYRLQYFEIPFGLKLRSDELPGGVRVFGQVGITAGFIISKKADYEVRYVDNAGVTKTAAGSKEKIFGTGVSPVLMQMNLGAGLEYSLTDKLSVYGGLFFDNGFAPDVTNPKNLDLDYSGKFSDGNTRLNNFALRIGLFF
jgi:hypothetical protein